MPIRPIPGCGSWCCGSEGCFDPCPLRTWPSGCNFPSTFNGILTLSGVCSPLDGYSWSGTLNCPCVASAGMTVGPDYATGVTIPFDSDHNLYINFGLVICNTIDNPDPQGVSIGTVWGLCNLLGSPCGAPPGDCILQNASYPNYDGWWDFPCSPKITISGSIPMFLGGTLSVLITEP